MTAVAEPLGSFALDTLTAMSWPSSAALHSLTSRTRVVEVVVPVEGCGPGGLARMNDGQCDWRGPLLGGQHVLPPRPAERRAVPPGRRSHGHPDVGRRHHSNGLDWARDDRTLYYIDTLALSLGPTSGIDAFDFDTRERNNLEPSPLVDIPTSGLARLAPRERPASGRGPESGPAIPLWLRPHLNPRRWQALSLLSRPMPLSFLRQVDEHPSALGLDHGQGRRPLPALHPGRRAGGLLVYAL